MDTISSAHENLEALRVRAKFNRLRGYEPYPFQRAYHDCISGRWEQGVFSPQGDEPAVAKQVLLSAGNQLGKSIGGYADDAIHATGLYPKWWNGPNLTEHLRRFPEIWVGGPNNDKVRDIGQKQLCGDPRQADLLGTGFIPKDRIAAKPVPKRGVANAIDSIQVRHAAGFIVHIVFKSYDASLLDWTGESVGLIHLDEEPPARYYEQSLARMIATGGWVKMTFTPEAGETEVLSQFMHDLKDGQLLIFAGTDDAKLPDGRTHLKKKELEQLLGAIPPHQRELRTTGKPILGAGAVFPVAESKVVLEHPVPLSPFWPRIIGMDFGSGGVNHPTAAVWLAIDTDSRSVYVYDEYKEPDTETAVHASAIRSRHEPDIPVAWPHDGNRSHKYGAGSETLRNIYAGPGHDLRMLSTHALNDEGTIAIEPGIRQMLLAMQEGRFKVFPHCKKFLMEMRMYHRKPEDNSIVSKNDDLMSAGRYGFLCRGKARIVDPRIQSKMRVSMVAEGTSDQNVFQW